MKQEKRKILAIDFGQKRVGLAISDELLITSSPLPAIYNRGQKILIDEVSEIISKNAVAKVVIGYPLLLSGEAGKEASIVEDFLEHLKEKNKNVEIILQDERFSSVFAGRILRENKKKNRRDGTIDSVAAALILETYLMSQKH